MQQGEFYGSWSALNTHSNSGYNIFSTQTYTNNPVTIICSNGRGVTRPLWIGQGQQLFFGLVVGAHQGLCTPLGIHLSPKTLLVLQSDACTGSAECHSGCAMIRQSIKDGSVQKRRWLSTVSRILDRLKYSTACLRYPSSSTGITELIRVNFSQSN